MGEGYVTQGQPDDGTNPRTRALNQQRKNSDIERITPSKSGISCCRIILAVSKLNNTQCGTNSSVHISTPVLTPLAAVDIVLLVDAQNYPLRWRCRLRAIAVGNPLHRPDENVSL